MPLTRLKFGTANHGWLPADLEVDGTQLRFMVSYTPNDFLLDLIHALHSALKYEGTDVATVNEEPTESDWTFVRTRDALAFTIIRHPHRRRDRGLGKTIAQTSGRPLDVVLPLWRGLQELKSRQLKEHFSGHWNEPFPAEALEKLTAHIESL